MAKGLDKVSTTYGNYNVWRSEVFSAPSSFRINKIRIPFSQAIAANMTLTVKVYGDDGSTTPSAETQTLVTVNSTNYTNSERSIDIFPRQEYQNNFFIQLEWSGTALLTVALPITIEIETHE